MIVPDGLFLSVNPKLRRFDRRLCKQLNVGTDVRYWCYDQAQDEPCCIETVLGLFHKHIQQHSQPVHLLGHGLSGGLALIYARMHPYSVKSLTLLSVGVNPSVDWHAHYYAMRKILPCGRDVILAQMVRMLFGPQSMNQVIYLVKLLAKVLDTELTLHSLSHYHRFSPGGINPPLLVCNGAWDAVVDQNSHRGWQQWLKTEDQLWTCPEGRYFFHYDFPELCSQKILSFWQNAVPRLAKTTCV